MRPSHASLDCPWYVQLVAAAGDNHLILLLLFLLLYHR